MLCSLFVQKGRLSCDPYPYVHPKGRFQPQRLDTRPPLPIPQAARPQWKRSGGGGRLRAFASVGLQAAAQRSAFRSRMGRGAGAAARRCRPGGRGSAGCLAGAQIGSLDTVNPVNTVSTGWAGGAGSCGLCALLPAGAGRAAFGGSWTNWREHLGQRQLSQPGVNRAAVQESAILVSRCRRTVIYVRRIVDRGERR